MLVAGVGVALAFAVSGCGGDAPSDDTGAAATASAGASTGTPSASEAPASEAPTAEAADDSPCQAAAFATLPDAVGESLGEGRLVTATVQSNDVRWTPVKCTWSTADDATRVDVEVAKAADFDQGTLVCGEPLGIGKDVEPVDDAPFDAWWTYETSSVSLRACPGDRLVDVTVETDGGDRTAMKIQAMLVARMVVDAAA